MVVQRRAEIEISVGSDGKLVRYSERLARGKRLQQRVLAAAERFDFDLGVAADHEHALRTLIEVNTDIALVVGLVDLPDVQTWIL